MARRNSNTVESESLGEATTTQGTRGPRAAINIGEVSARPSTRDISLARSSKTTNSEVYAIVRDAEFDVWTDIVADEANAKGVETYVRRSGQPKFLNVGINIAPGTYPPATDENGVEIPGKVLVGFRKTKERKQRKNAQTQAAPVAEFSDDVTE